MAKVQHDRPDPLRDELPEEVKAVLAAEFARLREFFDTSWHQDWQAWEHRRNTALTRRFYEDVEYT